MRSEIAMKRGEGEVSGGKTVKGMDGEESGKDKKRKIVLEERGVRKGEVREEEKKERDDGERQEEKGRRRKERMMV